jgi:nucleotide-binding universal stress UspA family protein
VEGSGATGQEQIMSSSRPPTSSPHAGHDSGHPSPPAAPVVVGVRGDEPEVLRLAAELAQAYEVSLHVVHAYWSTAGSADRYPGRDVPDALKEAGLRVLSDARHQRGDRAPAHVDYSLPFAPPASAIAAASKQARIVVLGTDDARWFERLAGRTVARHTALHAKCPVAVVPEGTREGPGEVVAAIDLGNVSDAALKFAVDISSRLGAVLRILSVVLAGPTDPGREQERAWLDRAVHGSRHLHPTLDIRTEVITDDAGEALARAAESARLVIIGRPSEPRMAPVFDRPVATGLLSAARCPIVVVPIETRHDWLHLS